MAIIKYKEGFDDWLDWFENQWRLDTPITTWAGRRYMYNPDKYDLVPKKEFRQELIEQKEKELKLLDDKRKLLEEDVKKLKSG